MLANVREAVEEELLAGGWLARWLETRPSRWAEEPLAAIWLSRRPGGVVIVTAGCRSRTPLKSAERRTEASARLKPLGMDAGLALSLYRTSTETGQEKKFCRNLWRLLTRRRRTWRALPTFQNSYVSLSAFRRWGTSPAELCNSQLLRSAVALWLNERRGRARMRALFCSVIIPATLILRSSPAHIERMAVAELPRSTEAQQRRQRRTEPSYIQLPPPPPADRRKDPAVANDDARVVLAADLE